MTRHEAIMTLGLNMAARENDIRTAWRKKAKFYHPDSEYGNMTAFLKCQKAFETLIPPAPQSIRVRAGSRSF
jgi:DnaJ-class molecular chaperone